MRSSLVVSVLVMVSSAEAKTGGSAEGDATRPAAPVATEREESTEPEEATELPPHLIGPIVVELGHGAEIAVPAGMRLYERAAAQEILRSAGDSYTGVVALLERPDASWSVVISAADVGYVVDDDANQLDADALLELLRRGNDEQNKQRRALGVSELVIDEWTERPRYDGPKHHLIWGILGHSTDGKVINVNTRVLGRRGFLSINLVDAPETLAASKVEALAILEATKFKQGYRYEEYREGDTHSGMDLRGLIIGGVGVGIAKKAGLLALLVVFLKKGGVLLVAGLGWISMKLFRRRRRSAPPPADPPPEARDE